MFFVLLVVAIGGALGSVVRYLFSTMVLRATGSLFPFGTFAVNVVGCLAIGVVMGLSEQRFVLSPGGRALIVIGFIGGFTTFSTFAFESFELLRDGQFVWAGLNIVGQVIGGLVGLWAGFNATR